MNSDIVSSDMNKILKRSPLFYVGDKYKLMPQLTKLFPGDIATFYDVFCGGGSVSLNATAKKYSLNDLDNNILLLHKALYKNSYNTSGYIKRMYSLIVEYGLSHSEISINDELSELKKIYKKTYFARYNKEKYIHLKEDYNNDTQNMDLLYLLLVYGFNHMIRFNSSGQFNLPVGNVDWNKNVTKSLEDYFEWCRNHEIEYSSGLDFEEFLNSKDIHKNDFVFLDPPYLITNSNYNKDWTIENEKRLYDVIDELTSNKVNWGLTNLISHKGRKNDLLIEWSKKYNIYNLDSNYISRFDNSIKVDSKEVYVTNIG